MKRKSNCAFFRYLAFGFEILLLWVLQSTPKLMPEVLGSKPFLLLAAALSFAACSKAVPAIVLGAVCGALSDISANGTVGYFSVAFTLVCYARRQCWLWARLSRLWDCTFCFSGCLPAFPTAARCL